MPEAGCCCFFWILVLIRYLNYDVTISYKPANDPTNAHENFAFMCVVFIDLGKLHECQLSSLLQVVTKARTTCWSSKPKGCTSMDGNGDDASRKIFILRANWLKISNVLIIYILFKIGNCSIIAILHWRVCFTVIIGTSVVLTDRTASLSCQ